MGMNEKICTRSSLGSNDSNEKGPSVPNPYLLLSMSVLSYCIITDTVELCGPTCFEPAGLSSLPFPPNDVWSSF